jgi:hypothetical protein
VSDMMCSISGVPSVQPGNVVKGVFIPVGPSARNASAGQMGLLFRLGIRGSVSSAFTATDTGNYSRATCKPVAVTAIRVSFGSYWKGVLSLKTSVCTALSSTSVRLIRSGTNG